MKRIFAIILAALAIGFAASAATTAPSFPGGDEAMQEFISSTMQYPAAARANGIEGVIDVDFTVKEDGTIGGIKIVRMVDPDLEQEAIRIVKLMPKWQPATDNGKNVAAPASVKIDFALE